MKKNTIEKIIIKRELVNIRNNQKRYDFAILPNLLDCNKGTTLDICANITNIKKETYEIREYKNNFGKKVKYLVKVDDFGIFNELAQITQDDLDNLRANHFMEFMMYTAPKIRTGVKNDIKNMSFFRKFKFLFF